MRRAVMAGILFLVQCQDACSNMTHITNFDLTSRMQFGHFKYSVLLTFYYRREPVCVMCLDQLIYNVYPYYCTEFFLLMSLLLNSSHVPHITWGDFWSSLKSFVRSFHVGWNCLTKASCNDFNLNGPASLVYNASVHLVQSGRKSARFPVRGRQFRRTLGLQRPSVPRHYEYMSYPLPL